MKINLSEIDPESFMTHPVDFCGMSATLVQPNHIGTRFNQKNKIFRSSIWSDEGELLSAGFPKFVNIGENPENFPPPTSLKGAKILSKIDGSLCICDYVNGQFSMRTRGTSSYKSLSNYYDFEHCDNKYPKIRDYIKTRPNLSLLFEITTPDLKIVIDYGNEADFTLIGAVNKDEYSLLTQYELDQISSIIEVKRPKYYSFNDLKELIESVKNFPEEEGVCLYTKNDQEIHKIKAMAYLKRHAFKSNASEENVIDLYFTYGKPAYGDFIKKLESDFDWECAQMVLPHVSKICDGMKEVSKLLSYMKEKVEPLKTIPRKNAAEIILQAYGETNRASFAFNILSGKELDNEQLKKLLYQILKK